MFVYSFSISASIFALRTRPSVSAFCGSFSLMPMYSWYVGSNSSKRASAATFATRSSLRASPLSFV